MTFCDAVAASHDHLGTLHTDSLHVQVTEIFSAGREARFFPGNLHSEISFIPQQSVLQATQVPKNIAATRETVQ